MLQKLLFLHNLARMTPYRICFLSQIHKKIMICGESKDGEVRVMYSVQPLLSRSILTQKYQSHHMTIDYWFVLLSLP